MKNKGFTLIEMLVVIAILGAVGVVVTISFVDSLNATRQEQCDAFVEEVENAACVYASLSSTTCVRSAGTCTVTVEELLEAGLLSTETDDCTGEDIDLTETVIITWDSSTGEKTCEYQRSDN